MNRIFLAISLVQLFFVVATAQSNHAWTDKISPEVLAAYHRNERMDVLISIEGRTDLSRAAQFVTKAEKADFVYRQLVETADRTQTRVISLLRTRGALINSFYLVNAVAVQEMDPALLPVLADMPEVRNIGLDPWVHFDQPLVEMPATIERDAIEWGVQKINAPLVWQQGYTGQGITIGGADTGYQWNHPALKGKYRGWNSDDATVNHNYNWHDAIHGFSPLSDTTLIDVCGFNSDEPCDDQAHGTHTMGTMTGDDGEGNRIGVAPGARWVGCRNMQSGNGKPSTYLECFQWFLAPTDLNGQHPDPGKAPHVINNSWYCSATEGCTDLSVNELLRQAVINLKASGVVVVVSNGNFGSQGCNSTYGPPAYFEESFSVGSTRFDDTLSGFSSRGPVTIDGSNRIKPNVTAPGSTVRSSVPINGYNVFSGTSMAGPHVAGMVALLLSARPDLAGNVELIEQIVEQSAVFKEDPNDCGSVDGTQRPNNAYGWGRIDALAGLEMILEQPAPTEGARVSVLPNPTSGRLLFDLANIDGNVTIHIFSADGKLVHQQQYQTTSFAHDWIQISLENVAVGVYFWQVKTTKETLTGKVVKE